VADFYAGAAATAQALIDPYGYVFDSRTGKAIDGARVTLVDQETGAPAKVFGDDGVSLYPSTVISGHDVTDAGGATYQYAPGQYRFPLVASGRYSLFVEPPEGYAARRRPPRPRSPSSRRRTATPSGSHPDHGARSSTWSRPIPCRSISRWTAASCPSSRRNFESGLSLEKSASTTKAAFGDFVRYTLSVKNLGAARTIAAVQLSDNLPRGFRYVAGSSRRDDVVPPDPAISADGRTLTYDLGTFGPSQASKINYLVRPSAPTRRPAGASTAPSPRARWAPPAARPRRGCAWLAPPLMTDAGTIVGRVTEGACATRREDGRVGVAGVRLVLEDGTFVVTDRDGLFHFEGVRPGLHVVQLDAGALPAGMEAVACGRDTRIAGRAFSQFVEIRGGGLQRVEFRLRRTGPKAPTQAGRGAAPPMRSTIDWFAGQEPRASASSSPPRATTRRPRPSASPSSMPRALGSA
jgi:uncharacterized repeat protein (TIGR01451 family)